MININISIINRELKLHITRPHNSTMDEERICVELESEIRKVYGAVNADIDKATSIDMDTINTEQTEKALKRIGWMV